MKQVDGQKLLASLGEGIGNIRGRLTPDAPMDRVTWFRAGGLAELMFHPHDVDDLVAFLQLVPESVPLMVVGVGSNLLVRDGGIPGIVIRLSAKGFGDLEIVGENRIKAGGHRDARYVEGPEALAPTIAAIAKPGDFVVLLGAGSITYWAQALPKELADISGMAE